MFLVRWSQRGQKGTRSEAQERSPKSTDIAIVGMSGRFPGSPNLCSFWHHLSTGTDLVSEVPREKWEMTSYFSEDRAAVGKSYSKWMGYLSDIDKFDPLFFNISPKEAEEMDPQHRLFLEESWRVIEDAGYAPSSLSEQSCGVFIGVGASDYGSDQKGDYQELYAYTLLGNSSSILSARISYLLNLKGPALSIDTACSSSLVAICKRCSKVPYPLTKTLEAGMSLR
ncbi:MAG: polyketide synthase [Bacteroidota bacterium]